MARDGSGTYSRVAGTPYVNGTVIDETVVNSEMDDIATALTNSLAKDGQTTPTANIPMGGFRLTGLGAATALTDAIQATQVQNGAVTKLGTVAGTNAITATVTPTPSAYAEGQVFSFTPANDNTGATTIDISSLGAKNIYWKNAACVGGELKANVPAQIRYDGTQFQLLNHGDVAALNKESQTLAGGASVTSKSLTTGSVTINPGARPLQYITNNGAFTITAPASDGSCLLLVTNGASAGSITFSGFTVSSSTGDSLTTTNRNKFTITIWRINGTSGYSITAHQ